MAWLDLTAVKKKKAQYIKNSAFCRVFRVARLSQRKVMHDALVDLEDIIIICSEVDVSKCLMMVSLKEEKD